MSRSTTAIRIRRLFRKSRLLQIGLVLAFWLAGTVFVRATGLPLPGGIAGMMLMLAALSMHKLSIKSLKRGADWLLADMLLFFVPAVLAGLDHPEFFSLLGVKLLAIILLSTLTVMGATALTVDVCYRWRARHGKSAFTA